eukprot:TRINITY_DN103215_c0_g1_i1.p1 TRINITY_DN103215_c0_g1~~TRINITY_DN103215_c0_g1_i1.p1  ORF type:complete len:464 (+),score=93.80 TRINITY_DN103215_c0_g1_i1:93-1484(+)
MAPAPAATKYVSEFLGTYLLVFTVGCNVLKGSPIWNIVSIGCVLMVSIYALADASGANFNPAVTLSLALSNAKPWPEALGYIAVQLVAGVSAAFSYSQLHQKAFALGPAATFGMAQAGACELLYTFMLCFVVLNVAASEKSPRKLPNQYFGLAIGFVIIAGGYSGGAVSGGAFNPAVAVGIESAAKMNGFEGEFWSPIYAAFEFAGAALAAGLYRVVRPIEFGGDPGLLSSLVAEFLGTFLLVMTVGLNVLMKSKAAVFSIAASLTCMIYALGDVSGANFNPAVSIAIALSGRGKLSGKDCVTYILVQLGAAVAAGIAYTKLIGKAFPLGPGDGFGLGQVAVAEITFTFLLCFVVLATATTKAPYGEFNGLAIGSCVTVGGLAIGAISGGSLNPAVSLGVSSAAALRGFPMDALGPYMAFEVIGGCMAALVFRVTHPQEYDDDALAKDATYGSMDEAAPLQQP